MEELARIALHPVTSDVGRVQINDSGNCISARQAAFLESWRPSTSDIEPPMTGSACQGMMYSVGALFT